MRYKIYVDSQYGSNGFEGSLQAPFKTLAYAYSNLYPGGKIILQNGTGGSYGDLEITKSLSLIGAYGSSPKVGKLTITDAQTSLQNLIFDAATGLVDQSVVIKSSNLGSASIRDCQFLETEDPVSISDVNYISLHRNFFRGYGRAIFITDSRELCASSNIFTDGARAIEAANVNRLDLWRNTVYGAGVYTPAGVDQNLRIIYHTITEFDIENKRVGLPGFATSNGSGGYDVAVNVVNGPSFGYGIDFIVIGSGSIISWSGLGLDGELSLGDVIRIMYSEGAGPSGGDAFRILNTGSDSRVDSNSMSGVVLGSDNPIGVGVYFTTPVKIRHNNFDLVDTWWDGATPTGDTGLYNISETAMYMDPNSGTPTGFRIQEGSPNIDSGDPGRWSNIYTEMGVIRVGSGYTGAYTGIREGVAPFDRDLDYNWLHRGVTGMHGVTGDIGAWEYQWHETALGNYVAEQGYDKAHPGSETAPYATIDRGYERAGAQTLNVFVNAVPYGESGGIYVLPSSGSHYGRYRSQDMALGSGDLSLGSNTDNDVVFVYGSYPTYETGAVYVDPDGNDSYTGTQDSPYRTIGRALQDSPSYVLVAPGFYPRFTASPGVRLIGLDVTHSVPLNKTTVSSFLDGSWTGIGDYDFSRTSLTFNSGSSIVSEYDFLPGFLCKHRALADGDLLTGGVQNNHNKVYVTYDKTGERLLLGYVTGETGTILYTYDLMVGLTGTYFDSAFRTTITVNDGKASIKTLNEYVNESRTVNLGYGWTAPWMIYYDSSSGGSVVSNMLLEATGLQGAAGFTGTFVQHHVYGIKGSTGIQGY